MTPCWHRHHDGSYEPLKLADMNQRIPVRTANARTPTMAEESPTSDSVAASGNPTTATRKRSVDLADALAAYRGQMVAFPRERTVVDFFRDQVTRRPNAVAVDDGTRRLDFATINRLSNRVANHLLQWGLKPEDVVALPLDVSCAYIIATLGVLKAGGSYLPLDLKTPDRRLELLMAESGAKFVLTEPRATRRFRAVHAEVFGLDDDASAFAGVSEAAPEVRVEPARRAYIIFTSGSTGKPKGAEIEHHSLTNLIWTYHQLLGLGPSDRVPLIANVAFDASVADLWPCLCAGGTIMIPPDGLLLELDKLIHWLADTGVTAAFIPTGLAEVMLTQEWPADMCLRLLGVGGDQLHGRPPQGLPFQLINQYGPTENTVDSIWAVVPPGSETEPPPIGYPLPNVTAYVLDDRGQSVTPGQAGELYLGGEQVARGYLHQSDLTAERFLPDPFSAQSGGRMYRTGDWVREGPDGMLYFIGRLDSQVQLHGRRVELGEIEQTLRQHPAVRQACCEPVLADGAATRLVAHVVMDDQQPRLETALRTYLAARLPSYMVPSSFVFHDQLPLTSRGKVDRSALRAAVAPHGNEFETSLPEGSPQKAIAELWFRLFPQAHQAEIHEPIDALGGDSLQAVKLLAGVEKIVGRRIPMSDFMINPTLPELFRLAVGNSVTKGEALVPIRADGHRPPLFCIYGLQGDIYHYYELARALGPDQPVIGIRSLALDDPTLLPKSMEEAAARAMRWLLESYPDCTPVLIGYSWGGILAFELARQWLRSGRPAPLVMLVGSPPPRQRASLLARIWHFLRWLPAWIERTARGGLRGTPGQMARRFLHFLVRDPAEIPDAVPDEDWASGPIAPHLMALDEAYRPVGGPPVEVHLMRETQGVEIRVPTPLDSTFVGHLPDWGWSRWAGRPVEVHWIEADHVSILQSPAVADLAALVRSLMDRR